MQERKEDTDKPSEEKKEQEDEEKNEMTIRTVRMTKMKIIYYYTDTLTLFISWFEGSEIVKSISVRYIMLWLQTIPILKKTA